MTKHEPRNSTVGRMISAEVGNQAKVDQDIDPCGVGNGGCFLSPGIEHLFVSLTAKAFVDHAWGNQRPYPYQQLIYSPHARVERAGGFDLSVGLVWRQDRLRMMHKLLSASRGTYPWCDESWIWKSTDCRGNTSEHIHKLVAANKVHGFLRPFLVIHVCFCLHEYRRMGSRIGGVTIPDFCDPRRTVVVDLTALGDDEDAQTMFKAGGYRVEVEYKAMDNKHFAKLIRIDKAIELPVHPFSVLLSRFLEITPTPARNAR